MKRLVVGALVALVCVAIGAGWWWKSRAGDDAPSADAAPAAPIAQVRTEVPRVRGVAETIFALGEVTPAQVDGLSFARGGQVTSLAVVVGDTVAKGATLATLAPDPAARQAYAQAVDAAALAQREQQRLQELMASHLATQSQLDAADKASRDAQGGVKALAEQDGGSASSTLVAPFDGVVAAVSAVQGDRVQAGAPVLQVARTDALRVVIGIEPAERARVRAGAHLTVTPIVAPGASAPAVDLVVDHVQQAVDPKTQRVDVVALLPHRSGASSASASFAPGMKVDARIQVGALQSLAVGRSAVLSDERGDYVFQVADGKARRVAVTRRLDDGTLAAIAGVANATLPIVVEGNYELQDGMAVREAAP
jgi:RND family efflux transporter MFP subunit